MTAPASDSHTMHRRKVASPSDLALVQIVSDLLDLLVCRMSCNQCFGQRIDTAADVLPEHEAVLGRMLRVAADIARAEGIADSGYRLIVNCKSDGGQEVPHLHLHLLGGRPLGPMLPRKP
jgi:hypothetical protein